MAEDEAAEWSDNQDLEWVGHVGVKADGLNPCQDQTGGEA